MRFGEDGFLAKMCFVPKEKCTKQNIVFLFETLVPFVFALCCRASVARSLKKHGLEAREIKVLVTSLVHFEAQGEPKCWLGICDKTVGVFPHSTPTHMTDS